MKNNIPIKLKLCYNSSLKQSIENNDIIFKLIKNYSEIINIIQYNSSNYLQFLYFNKNNIHKILYDYDEIISIDLNEKDKTFENYFYLYLLILDNSTIVNYTFSIDYIYEIKNLHNKIINEKLIKLILLKINIELINYYKSLDEYDENKNGKDLEIIKNDNININ